MQLPVRRSPRRWAWVSAGKPDLGWRFLKRSIMNITGFSRASRGPFLIPLFCVAVLETPPRVTSNWEGAAPSRRMRRTAPSGAAALSDEVLCARQRVVRALEAVGPELAGILIDVCCHLVGLADTEKSRGWPQRSGKVILKLALTRLARHYGIKDAGDPAGSVRTRLRHWGAVDFRPSLEKWR